MNPTWQTSDGTIALHNGDMRLVLPTFAPDSFTACVTDPPYELGFMGKGWDRSGVAFEAATWREVFRVLKPGAHLLAFGGTRTYHRMACAIEDAGFEIRDCIMWVYGIGFAKAFGYGGIYMLNLFAFRATLPDDMKRATDPIGPDNDEQLGYYQSRCGLLIAAWGKHGAHRGRQIEIKRVLRGPLYCLGTNGDGSPKHPLYLKGDTKPALWWSPRP